METTSTVSKTDPAIELEWRRSLAVGAQVAIEYHTEGKKGVAYLCNIQVSDIDGETIKAEDDHYSIQSGLSLRTDQSQWSAIVRPTPEIAEKDRLINDVNGLLDAIEREMDNTTYLPVGSLRHLRTTLMSALATTQEANSTEHSLPNTNADAKTFKTLFNRAVMERSRELYNTHIPAMADQSVAGLIAQGDMERAEVLIWGLTGYLMGKRYPTEPNDGAAIAAAIAGKEHPGAVRITRIRRLIKRFIVAGALRFAWAQSQEGAENFDIDPDICINIDGGF